MDSKIFDLKFVKIKVHAEVVGTVDDAIPEI